MAASDDMAPPKVRDLARATQEQCYLANTSARPTLANHVRGEVDEAQGEIEGESKGQIFGTKA